MAHSAVIWTALDQDLSSVESGVALSTLNQFIGESGLRPADIYEVVLPARTLKHRKARNEPLSLDESDKLARLVRVFNQAVRTFGASDKARQWLNAPKKPLRRPDTHPDAPYRNRRPHGGRDAGSDRIRHVCLEQFSCRCISQSGRPRASSPGKGPLHNAKRSQ